MFGILKMINLERHGEREWGQRCKTEGEGLLIDRISRIQSLTGGVI